uniref:Uncharacterized protein n=1 Tax=Lepeophtheirus salmonis TaxID=72036 RepID=A0A0K2U3R5_LEPSM
MTERRPSEEEREFSSSIHSSFFEIQLYFVSYSLKKN